MCLFDGCVVGCVQVRERTGSAPVQLQVLVKKLLIIISRMARLLEIMVRIVQWSVRLVEEGRQIAAGGWPGAGYFFTFFLTFSVLA